MGFSNTCSHKIWLPGQPTYLHSNYKYSNILSTHETLQNGTHFQTQISTHQVPRASMVG